MVVAMVKGGGDVVVDTTDFCTLNLIALIARDGESCMQILGSGNVSKMC